MSRQPDPLTHGTKNRNMFSVQAKQFRPNFPGQSGYSIVELMVALTIGIIILAAVATIFAGSRSTYQTDEGLARLQENARFALDFMNREIRLAGYFGCTRDTMREATNVYNNLNPDATGRRGGFAYDTRYPVAGFEYTGTAPADTYNIPAADPDPQGIAVSDWAPTLEASLQNRVLPGTDVIVIRRASDVSGFRLADPFWTPTVLHFEPGSAVSAGDILMVADCIKTSIFQATAIDTSGATVAVTHGAMPPAPLTGPGNALTTWPISQKYLEGGQIIRAITTVFYIGRGTSGSPALFMTMSDPSQASGLRHLELAEGVENMQVLYGVDTDGATAPLDYPNRYMTATDVEGITTISAITGSPETGWGRLMSVRIALLVRTSNVSGQADQSRDTGTYDLFGTTIDPVDDNRRRRVFTTTIQLRNRIAG